MKIRTRFVSNSSSSSFILIGFVLDKKEYTKLEIAKILWPEDHEGIEEDEDWNSNELDYPGEDGIVVLSTQDEGAPKGKFAIGQKIAGINSGSEIDKELTLDLEDSEIISKIKKISKKFGKDNHIRLITGNPLN